MINLYDFGPESNIKLTLPDEIAEGYNKFVKLKWDEDGETDLDLYQHYITVTTLIGKKSFELSEAGEEPIRGTQKHLTLAPENNNTQDENNTNNKENA